MAWRRDNVRDNSGEKEAVVAMRKLRLLLGGVAVFVVLALISGSGFTAPKQLSATLVLVGGGHLGDKSFSDSAHAGLLRAEKELGAKVSVLESPEVASQEENVRAVAEEGTDLIILLSYSAVDVLKAVAPDYPKTKFLIVDAVVDGPNVKSITFNEHEGSFLLGVCAGMMTKTNVVGFIGGADVPLIHRFELGYIQGAKYINSKVKVLSGYAGSFFDPAKGKELAYVQIANKADVIYHAAGPTGLGLFEAAKEKKIYAMGVDSDQCYLAPEVMIGSMMKRVDNAVFNTIKAVKDGTFKGGTEVYGLQVDGVGHCALPPLNCEHATKLLPKRVIDAMAKARQDIIAGKIHVKDYMAGERE